MKTLLKVINIVGNMIILNFLFLLTSGGTLLICFGTSLSALYATFLDLKTDNSGYYVRNYFKHFKGNLKYTIIVDIILILIAGCGYLNYLMVNTIEDSTIKLIGFAVITLILFEIGLIASFIFPVIAKFKGDLMHLLYLAFYFAHRYIYISILFIILFIGSIFLVIYVSLGFLAIIFGLIYFFESFLLKKLWKKYKYEGAI